MAQEEDWDLEDLVEMDSVERVGVKRRLRDLQDSCRTKRRRIPETIADAVGLAAELVSDVAVAPSPGKTSPVGDGTRRLTNEMSMQIRNALAKVDTLSAKVTELEGSMKGARKGCDNAVTALKNELCGADKDASEKTKEHEAPMKKLRAEAKAVETHLHAEKDGALPCNHDVLLSVRQTVKAGDERGANMRLRFRSCGSYSRRVV